MLTWIAVGLVVGIGLGWAIDHAYTRKMVYEHELDCAMKLGAISLKLVEAVKNGDRLVTVLYTMRASARPSEATMHDMKRAVEMWRRDTANVRPAEEKVGLSG